LEKSISIDPAENQTADCPACMQNVHMENKLQTGIHSSPIIDKGRSKYLQQWTGTCTNIFKGWNQTSKIILPQELHN
jgi:hypothetical protein